MRVARPADAASLRPLLEAFYEEDGIPFAPACLLALQALLATEAYGRVLVEEDETGAPLGYVVLTFGFSLELGGRDAFVDELYVVPTARRRGIGRRLLSGALDVARGEGIGTVLLEVAAPDAAKLAFYASAGFHARPYPLLACATSPGADGAAGGEGDCRHAPTE